MASELKTIAVDYTASGATDAIELGSTPFFPGTSCILDTGVVIPSSTTVKIQGAATDSADDDDWNDLLTVTAGEGPQFTVPGLYQWLRCNVTDTGSGSAQFGFTGTF